jgi:GTP cyclohydrolase I
MNAPENIFLPDVQSSHDERKIVIQKVGVKSIRHPLTLKTKDGSQATVATIDMTVKLPAHIKGTHMSRFLEILQSHHEPISFQSVQTLMKNMLVRLEADEGHIEMKMPLFINKTAPVSGVQSLLDYDVHIKASVEKGQSRFVLGVQVPVTSLCPCSKKISEYGAHNQRSHIVISAEIADDLAVEDLILIAEQAASCELWGLLKRPDEKYVTERAYDNPKFVEDLVRDIAVALHQEEKIVAYEVSSENFESIHNHSAYAWLANDKRLAS